SSCAPAHNTPPPLERSPPASFKRLLGARLAEPIGVLAAKQVLKGFPRMSEEQPRATSQRVPRSETLVALTATGEKTEQRVLNEAKVVRSEEHTSELQSRGQLVCRLLLEKKKWRRLKSCS